MFRHASIHARALALAVITASLSPAISAADDQTFLNAPKWKLEYQVNFKGAGEYAAGSLHGPTQSKATLESGFSAELVLDLRNGGAGGLTMTRTMSTPDGSTLSTEEAQKRMMDLVMRTETLANWTTGGAMVLAETDEAVQAAVAASMEAGNCTGYLKSTLVTVGPSLFDETGSEYSLVSHQTINDTGTVKAASNLTLDIDAQTKHYAFSLAHEFQDEGTQAKLVRIDTVTAKGSSPTVERTETAVKLAFPAAIMIDDPTVLFGSILLIEGTYDPSAGKITGERTVPAHCMEDPTKVKGTLSVRFTLTPRLE